MKMRRHTLWRVPVYCVIASILSYYLTIALSFLYIDTDVSVDAEGAIETMINPVRSATMDGTIFLAVLLVGGFCFLRSMTRKEIAVSAAIMSAIYLVFVIWEIWLPTPFPLWLVIIQIQDWISHLSSVLIWLTETLLLPCTFLSCFAPFLFVLFGKGADETDNPEKIESKLTSSCSEREVEEDQ